MTDIVHQIWWIAFKFEWHIHFGLATTKKTSIFLCWFMVGNKYHLHVQTRDTVVCYYLARGLPFAPVTPKGSFWVSSLCFFKKRGSFTKDAGTEHSSYVRSICISTITWTLLWNVEHLLRYSPIYFDNLWYLKQTPKTHVEFSNKTSLFLLPASCSI